MSTILGRRLFLLQAWNKVRMRARMVILNEYGNAKAVDSL